MVVAELGGLVASSSVIRMIENGNMWFDATLMDEPGDICGIVITSIGGKALLPDAKSFLGPADHRSLRRHLGGRMAVGASTSTITAFAKSIRS